MLEIIAVIFIVAMGVLVGNDVYNNQNVQTPPVQQEQVR